MLLDLDQYRLPALLVQMNTSIDLGLFQLRGLALTCTLGIMLL